MCDREVLGFRHGVVEVSSLLGHEAASLGYWFPILGDETTALSRNVENRQSSGVASYPWRTETSYVQFFSNTFSL
jgi:hypothetical protein